jgi:hypothetical protein
LLQLAAENRLTPSSFADIVLGKSDVLLTGLHALFDGGPRMKREIRRGNLHGDAYMICACLMLTISDDICAMVEGEMMLQTLKRNYTAYNSFEEEEEDDSETPAAPARAAPSAATPASRSHRTTVVGHPQSTAPVPTEGIDSASFGGVASLAASGASDGAASSGKGRGRVFDAVITQAELCFSAPSESLSPGGEVGGAASRTAANVKSIQPLHPDQYFSLQSMKVCL